MGGNIDDSRPPPGAAGGTLLGPEGTAARLVLRFRVQARRPHRRPVSGWAGGLRWGLGFGGVFVNWIVDASI
jgi:hypothetical protein